MDSTDVTATLRRLGAGVAVGGPAVLALSVLVLAEIAVLLVLCSALLTYVLARRSGHGAGLAQGIAAGALFVIVDRQLDVGATVARSAAATVAIGVGIVVATLIVDHGAVRRLQRD